jgi:DNA-binding beta-propeller fold protein YncE
MNKSAEATRRTPAPDLAEILAAELGEREGHDTNIDVALHGGLLYATHSYAPIVTPNSPVGIGDLVVLDLATLAEVRRVPVGAKPRRVAVHPTSGRAYMICDAPAPVFGRLLMVDHGADVPSGGVDLGWGATDVAVDGTLGRVYVASARTKSVRVLDEDGEDLADLALGNRVIALAIDQNRGLAYAAVESPTDNRLAVIDGAALSVAKSIPLDATNVVPQDVAVDEARNEVYVACVGGVGHTGPSVFAVSPATDSVRRIALPTPARTVEADPAVGQLWVSGEGRVYVLDAASGALVEQASFEGRPGRIALDRSTGIAYVGQRWPGRVAAYRSAAARPAPPPPAPTLSFSGNGDRMNLFRQAADGSVETAAYAEDADWTPFAPLVAPPDSTFPPGTRFASLSPERGRWWLFGVDAAGVLWGTSGAGQAAGAWHEIGAGFVPGAEVAWASVSPGGVILFAVDAGGTVRSFGWNDGGPGGSEVVHGGQTFAPGAPVSAVSRKRGHWDLFVLHPDGSVYTQWWSAGEDAPSPWGSLDGDPLAPGTRVSALGRKGDQLDLFAVDPAGKVVSNFWNDEQGWHSWAPVAGGGEFVPGSAVAVTSAKPDVVNLFAAGQDTRIWTTFWKAEDGWADWRFLKGPQKDPADDPAWAASPGAAVVVGRRAHEELDLAWLGQNGRVEHAWWGRWQGRHGEGDWSVETGVTRPVGTQSVHFPPVEIRTGTPVKGNVRATLWEDGSFLFKGHMNNGGGVPPYDFVVQASAPSHITNADYMVLENYRPGRLDGWEPFGDAERRYSWWDAGRNPYVQLQFTTIRDSGERELIVSHTVKAGGVVGALESLVGDVISQHLLKDVLHTVGGTLVMACAIGRGLEDVIGFDLGDDSGLLGLGIITVATGGLGWLAVPAAAVLIPMLPGGSGVPVGAKERPMDTLEHKWAEQEVFGGTLPPPSSIRITNLKSITDKAFVSVAGDGDQATYLVHLGEKAYDDPMTDLDPPYQDQDPPHGVLAPAPGATLIHELAHVWEAHHGKPWWEWEALWDQCSIGAIPPHPSRPWDDLGIEEKANAVSYWYSKYHLNLEGSAAVADRYFRYIRDHIRKP